MLRFSVGFGKPLLSRKAGVDQTEYVLAAIPLGGYVKMLDEREGPSPMQTCIARSPASRPGSASSCCSRVPPSTSSSRFCCSPVCSWFPASPRCGRWSATSIRQDSPAQRAGLRTGDEILTLDGRNVAGQRDVSIFLLEEMSDDGRAELQVQTRDGARRTLSLAVEDATERRRLTEPEELYRGLGFDYWRPPAAAVLQTVEPDGPAARGGLAAGDEILTLNGNAVRDVRDLKAQIEAHPGESIVVTYKRAGAEHTARIELPSEEVDGRRIGRMHVGLPTGGRYPAEMLTLTSLGPFAALSKASGEAWDMTALQARIFYRMLVGQVSLKNLTGPLTIAEYAGDTAQAGLSSFLGFLVLVSLSLGFLNLLPIPILDGGQIVYQLLEWVKGSPLSDRAQALGQQMGIALLMLLMGVALFNDIARQFG